MDDLRISDGNLIKRDETSFAIIDDESDPEMDWASYQLTVAKLGDRIGICGYGERVDYVYYSLADMKVILKEIERLISE